jgi:hypothetical protein
MKTFNPIVMSADVIDIEALLESPSIRKSVSEFCGVDLTTKHFTPMQVTLLILETCRKKQAELTISKLVV